MLPFNAPKGTSPRDYLVSVVPEAHRSLVGPPSKAPSGNKATKRWDVLVSIPGEVTVLYGIDGQDIQVTEARSGDDAELSLTLERGDVTRFLEDWSGLRKWVPKFEPRGAALITDPQVVSRIAMVTGSVEAVLPDLEGGPARLVVAAFGGKRGRFEGGIDRPDTTVDLGASVFEAMLAGRMAPDEALSSGAVGIKGKKLVAMQFAFALAPFFPAK